MSEALTPEKLDELAETFTETGSLLPDEFSRLISSYRSLLGESDARETGRRAGRDAKEICDQLIAAQPPVSGEAAEAVARIIDPETWAARDAAKGPMVPSPLIGPSARALAKADQIIDLLRGSHVTVPEVPSAGQGPPSDAVLEAMAEAYDMALHADTASILWGLAKEAQPGASAFVARARKAMKAALAKFPTPTPGAPPSGSVLERVDAYVEALRLANMVPTPANVNAANDARQAIVALNGEASGGGALSTGRVSPDGLEPIGCPLPGACSCPSPQTPNQRAAIICDFMGWPQDGPAWKDAHRLSASLSATPGGVGEGWQLVPIAPTDEMLAAADSAIPRFEPDERGHRLMGTDGALEAWVAMIDAAPSPNTGEPVDSAEDLAEDRARADDDWFFDMDGKP